MTLCGEVPRFPSGRAGDTAGLCNQSESMVSVPPNLAPNSGTAGNPAYIPELDGFRALSILAVLACHMLPLGPAAWQGNVTVGYMGMSVFFALSGFLIARFLWEEPLAGPFFVRRFARIVPLVVLVSIIYALILEGRPDTFLAVNLYVANYWFSAASSSTSPMWSLGVEMHFYLAIGLAVALFGRRGLWLIPIAAVAVMCCRIDNGHFGALKTHLRGDEILSGALLGLFWLHRSEGFASAIWARLPGIFWPVTVLWAISCWPPSEWVGYLRPYLTALMIGSVLATRDGWRGQFLSGRALRYIATISFALYLWHSPFRHGWFDPDDPVQKYLVARPIGFAFTFLLAHLSTFYFEKPILSAVKRWEKRRSAEDPVGVVTRT